MVIVEVITPMGEALDAVFIALCSYYSVSGRGHRKEAVRNVYTLCATVIGPKLFNSVFDEILHVVVTGNGIFDGACSVKLIIPSIKAKFYLLK